MDVSQFDLRGNARSQHAPVSSRAHAFEPHDDPDQDRDHVALVEDESAPKQFLKRRSQAVQPIKVDWSHVRPKTVTSRSVDPRPYPHPPIP